MSTKQVVVVGSCMIDFVSFSPRLPKPGETIHGTKFLQTFGGKGANQCVAAAKLGGKATLVARVGDDIWGDQYIANLKAQNIITKHVYKTTDVSSGIAQITVASNGDNQIVIIPGANTDLSVDDVNRAKEDIIGADVLVLQLETSSSVAIRAMELCEGMSILNGAPATSEFDPRLLTLPGIFCVNETEAATFTGLPVTTKEEAKVAAKKLINLGCKRAIVTLGAQGALYIEKERDDIVTVSSPQVQCIDSTGAGDAFIGALAFMLANYADIPMQKQLETACFLAADSVTRVGTQISFSKQDALERCVKMGSIRADRSL